MAKELAREYRHDLGAVVVRIQTDELAPIEVHTIYVAAPDGCPTCGRHVISGGPVDVEAVIRTRLQEADAHRAHVIESMKAAGWQG